VARSKTKVVGPPPACKKNVTAGATKKARAQHVLSGFRILESP
jgi:hypothetical protein